MPQMIKIQQQPEHGCVYITHRNSSRTNNVISYKFDQSVNYNRVILESASFSQTFLNVSSLTGNNRISFIIDGGVQQTFAIADGFYDPSGLMTLVVQALNSVHNYFSFTVADYHVSIVVQTGHTLQLARFGSVQQDKIYDMLGFSSSHVVFSFPRPGTIKADTPYNMQPITMLLLKSDQFRSLFQVQNQTAPFSIPVSVEYGYFQTYQRPNDFTCNEIQQARGQQIQVYSLDFTLLNECFESLQVPANFTYCFKFVFER